MQPASATRNDAIPSVGSEELAEGLMLVRASTLKVIRLQLAMERRDRRAALEAIDDLVALDRSLEDYLSQVASAQDDGLFSNVLELERSALNVEKYTLAAEISTKWQAAPPEPEATEASEPGASEDTAGADWTPYYGEEPESQGWWRGAAILGAVLAIACAAYLLGASGLMTDLIGQLL